MTTRVLIIGGYGNFGGFIAKILAREENIQLIIAGRNKAKAEKAAKLLVAKNIPIAVAIDIDCDLAKSIDDIKPDVIIHTSGPYQDQSYHVAQLCIEYGCHYIDLADAREFVVGITKLNTQAKEKNLLICSGASTVPSLTSSIIDHYLNEFHKLEKLEYAITIAQRTNRGLATMQSVLSYAGKPFTTLIDGEVKKVYGWLGLTWRRFWGLNLRALCYCDIPDLDLFPKRYQNLKTICFRAGLESKLQQLTLVMLSWMVRAKILNSIQPLSKILLRLSFIFDPFGKKDSGFYMLLSGKNKNGQNKQIKFELVARDGDGLIIPSIPAIIIAKKIANNQLTKIGARASLDLITFEEYKEIMSEFNIKWRTTYLS